jgi:AraC-like DNA-binding protein
LYVPDVTARSEVTAWRPRLPGVVEVFHAHFTDHVYPSHTHAVWTLLIVDDGAVRFDLDRHQHGALRSQVTLLPPHVPHDGRSATAHGFRKRVLYLDTSVWGEDLVGAAVDSPGWADPLLRHRVDQLHRVLADRREPLAGESRLAFIRERLGQRLRHRDPLAAPPATTPRDRLLADRLRELLDASVVPGVTLQEAGRLLGAHPTHLVRAFSHRHGLPPHRYLTARRVELARGLLLDGRRPSDVAQAAGFYDQSHLNRHFTRMLGTSPARYAGR